MSRDKGKAEVAHQRPGLRLDRLLVQQVKVDHPLEPRHHALHACVLELHAEVVLKDALYQAVVFTTGIKHPKNGFVPRHISSKMVTLTSEVHYLDGMVFANSPPPTLSTLSFSALYRSYQKVLLKMSKLSLPSSLTWE